MSETTDSSSSHDRRRRLPRLRSEDKLAAIALLGGAPATLVALGLVWLAPASGSAGSELIGKLLISVLVAAPWVTSAILLRRRIVYSLRTLASLLEALRQEDYSMRARRATRRGDRPSDVLDEVHREINMLSETLSSQRLSALEATALLRTVMSEIDLAIFTFDPDGRLRLVNRSAERLMARPRSRLLGSTAAELGLEDWLEGEIHGTVDRTFPGAVGRWGVRRSSFRREGVPHQLLVIADLSKTLRHEERQSWQRLIRVIGHELNNSLAPIQSTADTLQGLVRAEPKDDEWQEDMRRGLEVIRQRSAALARFMASYSQLARLPEPRLEPLDIAGVVRHAAALENRLTVEVQGGPELEVRADRGQIEQSLINLVKNGVDAALETDGAVLVSWAKRAQSLEIIVEDEGPGLADTRNLFVPFFTTKRGGSGIGLVFSRQIAEAHGGSLTVENRTDHSGCRARLRLPVS